jgi:hypothetical protein
VNAGTRCISTERPGKAALKVFGYEAGLDQLRTWDGMKVAKAKSRGLRGKQPKLNPNQAKHLFELHDSRNSPNLNLPKCRIAP